MTDDPSFLSTIIANPDDLLPRLVYADWIEERGYPERAELIRLQARYNDVSRDSPEFFDMIWRSAELLVQNRARWTQDFAPIAQVDYLDFRNGFPEVVELPFAEFQRAGSKLFEMAPIRTIVLTGELPSLSTVFGCDWPESVRVRVPCWYASRESGLRDWEGVDLLRRAPGRLETFLQDGKWLVLAYAIWSGPDVSVARRFVAAMQSDFIHSFHSRGIRVAVRPFDHEKEFATWCPMQAIQSPLWISLRAGSLVEHRIGLDLPDELRSEPEDPEDEFYPDLE